MCTSTLLTLEDRHHLLEAARQVLEARVLGLPAVHADDDIRRVEGMASGAFVSVHRHGELRGCLGRLEALPLEALVCDLARAVADSDPRFEPLAASELPEIDIEISVLSPERRIHAPDEIEVGRHGLIVEDGRRRGLLLPQVASERGWDRLAFLEQACLKAGLSRDAWRRAHIFVFEAEVFGERELDRHGTAEAPPRHCAEGDRCASGRTPSE